MASFLDARGQTQQLQLDVTAYALAAEQGMGLAQYLNTTYQTNAEAYGTVFQQVLESEGIFMRKDAELGIRASTMHDILNGRTATSAGGINVKDAVPTSRILFPAVIMQAVEDKLIARLDMTTRAFDEMIAMDESISGERYEQPVLNFDRPSQARHQGISQLARPASMLTITTSERAFKIPTFALGLEVSDQALRSTTIDFVALSLARQAAVESNERAQNYILALLNGDVDEGTSSLASLGLMKNASTYDAAATGGAITQRAWMKYLMDNGTKRTITHLITDVDTAMKIEARTGKPTVSNDDSQTHRFDTHFNVMNPTWAKNPQLFLTDIASWPANTILGLDRNWAIRRVRNLNADYQAVEAYVMRRSTQMRMDFGEHVNRLYDDAFGGLVLA